jgi:hypothetical protein
MDPPNYVYCARWQGMHQCEWGHDLLLQNIPGAQVGRPPIPYPQSFLIWLLTLYPLLCQGVLRGIH